MDAPKSVGIWIRVSTEDQARGDSPEHHEKRARFYAESKAWNVREVYHLEALSGGFNELIPAYTALIQDSLPIAKAQGLGEEQIAEIKDLLESFRHAGKA